MGKLEVRAEGHDEEGRRGFARALLDDLTTLERMMASGMIENGVRRIGAEQEMFLVDHSGRPAPVSLKVLERLGDDRFIPEIGLFNIEFTVAPRLIGADFLQWLHTSLTEGVERVREAARGLGADVVLVGILPSIELADLSLGNLTPRARYQELNRVMSAMAGGELRTLINGTDQLQITHDNMMLEAANTSLQLHLQVGPEEAPNLYNLAQVITGPMVAVAANAPLFLHHRLWHETRIALFEQSLDIRSAPGRIRDTWQRVTFGRDWIHASVLEIYREQVARHRILLHVDVDTPSSVILAAGGIPTLPALAAHNGTIYRWNRLCYGISDGRPHLRIEHRALPAGPTVLDEVSNAAFFYGLMAGLSDTYDDVRQAFRFDDIKTNFLTAARYGLDASMRWADSDVVPVRELVLETLLPIARRGLTRVGTTEHDISRYLGIIEQRVRTGQNGARWQLDVWDRLDNSRTRTIRSQRVSRAILRAQQDEDPVHTWGLPDREMDTRWQDLYRTVGQVMTTDVFTVSPDDLVDVAASLMQWKHIRHVPVEDAAGNLVGLVSYRALLRLVAEGRHETGSSVAVRELMHAQPVTTTPQTTCLEAVDLMRRHGVGCLPVVLDNRLVGIVSERDFLGVAARLFEDEVRAAGTDGTSSEETSQ